MAQSVLRITRRKIEQAIADRFGLDVILIRGNGYYYFASDDDESSEVVYRLPTTSVYTMQLNGGIVTLSWWVDQFEGMLEDGGYIDTDNYVRIP